MQSRGFLPQEATSLVRLRQRYERGDFRELTDAARRLRFGRWLVAHGRLSDWPSGEERRIP